MADPSRRKKLGIDDSLCDTFESPDPVDPAPLIAHAELEESRRSEKEARPSAGAPIDRGPLEAAHARQVFQARDAVSLPPDTDFSHASHARRREEWRLLGRRERSLETPEERFLRLRAEVSELESDLALAEAEGPGSTAGVPFPSDLKREVRELQERLLTMSVATGGAQQQPTSAYEAAMDRMRRLGVASSQPSQPSGGGAPDPRAAGRAGGDFAAVEQKLARLEAVIGDGDLAALFPDICTALDALETKLAMTEDSKIQAAGKQVQALEQQLSRIKGKDGDGGAVWSTKTIQICEMLERWDGVAMVLPSLLGRLRTLKSLHEDAASVVGDVTALRSVHDTTQASIKEQEEALKAARASLDANMGTIKANVESIEQRIRALEGKP